MKEKIIKILIVLFVPFFLFLISIINFSNFINSKDFLIFSLIIIFPLLFLIQGILNAIYLKKEKAIVNLLISLGSFILIMLIFLNSSAFIYVIIYSIFYTIGFFLLHFINSYLK
jgi:hypothetical protein